MIIEIESEEMVEDGGFWKWWVLKLLGFEKEEERVGLTKIPFFFILNVATCSNPIASYTS